MSRLLLAASCVIAVSLLLPGCGGGGGSGGYEDEYSYEEDEVESDPADVDAADVAEIAFDNCTDDCSGHEAGFQWAQDNDVTDTSECSGDSDSFVEGCEAFAEARMEQAEEEAVESAQYEEESYEDEDASRF